MHILITGGAGFIGSHLADELLRHGHRVRALDNLWEQVHGADAARPAYLNADVELIRGDVRDPAAVHQALGGIDAVYHFAAAVGVGQSMYEVADYTSINNLGTATVLEALMTHPVQRLVVASSMSLYGEGLYRASSGQIVAGTERSIDQLRAGEWELRDHDGQPLAPIPTTEEKPPTLASVYALSKFDQERLCLMIGRAYAIPAPTAEGDLPQIELVTAQGRSCGRFTLPAPARSITIGRDGTVAEEIGYCHYQWWPQLLE